MTTIQPDIVQQTLFAQESVKQLHEIDFDLESDIKINLKYPECILVLFYVDNIESKNLTQIWSVAAKQVVGPVFAACNLKVERRVAEAFTSLNMTNTSLHWAALKTLPFVLVYQNGWPIAFYNGERAVQPFIDYALTLACRADYHEPFNLFGGMQAQDNLMMKGITQYGIKQDPFKKDSEAFTAKEDIRGYSPEDTPKLAGSPQELEESAHVRAEEEAAGGIAIEGQQLPPTAIPEGVGGTRIAQPTPQGLPALGAPTGEEEKPTGPPPVPP